MSEFEVLDGVLRGLDRVCAHLASNLAAWDGLGPGPIDAALAAVGDILGSDRAAFESAPEGSPSGDDPHVWSRAVPANSGESALKVPVVFAGRPFAALVIEQRSDRSPLEPPVEHRLQTLANLMAVALQRGRQARELERAQAEIARLNSGPVVCFTSLVDGAEFQDVIGDSPLLRTALARVQEVAPPTRRSC